MNWDHIHAPGEQKWVSDWVCVKVSVSEKLSSLLWPVLSHEQQESTELLLWQQRWNTVVLVVGDGVCVCMYVRNRWLTALCLSNSLLADLSACKSHACWLASPLSAHAPPDEHWLRDQIIEIYRPFLTFFF